MNIFKFKMSVICLDCETLTSDRYLNMATYLCAFDVGDLPGGDN